MMKKQWLTLSLVFLLLACSKVENTPVPIEVVRVTDTAVPPTATATLLPTAAHTAIPTAIIPTNTPSPTATLVPTETPTPSPTVPIWVAGGTAVPQPSAIIAPDNAAQVTELARWGRGVINDVAYSGDGRWLAVGTATGIYIHDAHDLEIIVHVIPTQFAVQAVTLSPNGELLAAATFDDLVQVWQTADWTIISTFEQEASDLRFAPDNETLAIISAFRHSQVSIWNIFTNKLSSFDGWTAAFAPDGASFAVVLSRRTEVVIGQIDGTTSETFITLGMDKGIMSLAFSLDGQHLVLGVVSDFPEQAGIEVYRIADAELAYKYDLVYMMNVSHLCDRKNANCQQYSMPRPTKIVYSPAGDQFAVVYTSENRRYTAVHLHRASDGAFIYEFPPDLKDLVFLPNEATLITTSWNGQLQEWDTHNLTLLQTVEGYEAPITGIIVSPDNQFIALQRENDVQIRAVQDGAIWQTYADASSIAFASNGEVFAIGYGNGDIELRHMTTGEIISTLLGHTDAVTQLLFTPSGGMLVSSANDFISHVWQSSTGAFLRTLDSYLAVINPDPRETFLQITDMAFLSDGQTLIADFSRYLGAWDINNGSLLAVYSIIQEDPIDEGDTNIFFSEETITAVAPASGNLANALWTANGRYLESHLQVPSDNGYISRFAFSPNGDVVVSTSWKGNLSIWNLSDGDLLGYYPLVIYGSLGNYSVTGATVAFSPDGRFLATGSSDGTVRLWGIP